MRPTTRARGWTVGWVGGGAVVLIAATLLVTITALARRIARQADEITAALDGAERHTEPLWRLRDVNSALSRVVDRLASPDSELAS